MTREQAQRWVDKGWARWLDERTLEVLPGEPLYRRQGVLDHVPGPSIVRFLGKDR